MLTYSHAQSLAESARDISNGKPLENNTRLYERKAWGSDDTYYAVQLHATDVVDILPNGNFRVSTGGWYTVTTRDRITTYSPLSHRTFWSEDGCWMLACRAKASDPEPPWADRTIPKPYTAHDPGPEPVKTGDGCIADEREGVTEQHTTYVWSNELRDAYERANGNVPDAWPVRDGDFEEPTRARNVLAWINTVTNEESHAMIYARTWRTRWTVYGEESYRYGGLGVGENYKQCPHCHAHTKRHDEWRRAMHGGWGHSHGGYQLMRDMLERYGSREAWQEAYITEFREVREARKVHRAWRERNVMPFVDGVEIDSEGYPLRRESEAYFKRQRDIARAERREQREREAQARERRQIERFQARMSKQRGISFERAASEAATGIRELRLVVNNGVRTDDSQEVA